MYFDALTLAAVADELRTTILGGRVQRVLLPDPLSVGLEVYANRQRYQVIASAHPQLARVHLTQHKPSRGVEQATPLLLLLRKYILGGRIVAIEQPQLERILVFSIVKEAESGNHSSDPPSDEQVTAAAALLRCELIVEPMDRRSNIVLVDDNNTILESVKRVPSTMSQRVMLPRQPYELPPRQDKRDPRTATGSGIYALRDLEQPALARALVKGYRGVSPQVAREVVQRAVGHTQARLEDETLPWEAIAAHLRELFTAPWQPTLAMDDTQQPVAYAPYALTHIPGAEPQASISTALDAFYTARQSLTAHRQRREAVQQQLETTHERLQHQHTQIEDELVRIEDIDRLRWEGEMIYAFLHTLAPGQTTLEVEGQTIDLDPEAGPVESAQRRFHTYQRARGGRERLHQRRDETRHRLSALEQLIALLGVADEREQIDQIAAEAEEQGFLAPSGKLKSGKKKRPPARRKPLHLVSSDGFDIYVGRSGVQNDEVTFRIGRPEDLWLHVRTIPGAHVIVRSRGGDVPARTLHEAAGVAAYFSAARTEAGVDVEISRRRQVRKIRGAPPGLVTYRAEQTIRVPPLPPWG